MNGEISITSRHFDQSEASGEPKLNEVKPLKMHLSLSQLKDLVPLFYTILGYDRNDESNKKIPISSTKMIKKFNFYY